MCIRDSYRPVLVYDLAGPGIGLLGAYELGPGALVHSEVWQQFVITSNKVFVARGLDDELVKGHIGFL